MPVVTSALIAIVACAAALGAQDEFARARQQLVQEIASITRETGTDEARKAFDARALAAMQKVPRHLFVPSDQVAYAYENRPLPIGYGQTISQPYIVA